MVNRMMDKKMYSHKKVQVARWRVGRLEGEILGLSFDGVVLWDSIPTRSDELIARVAAAARQNLC